MRASPAAASITEVQWSEVRSTVQACNPTLAALIDELDPGPEYRLFKASYPFGSFLLHKGQFMVPGKDGAVYPITDPALPSDLCQGLDYNRANPLALALSNSCEVFMQVDRDVVPFSMVRPGSLFGLWGALPTDFCYDQEHVWNITAGGRSIFMLPQISDTASHRRVQRELGIESHVPRNMLDHWSLFVDLVQKSANPWAFEVLFFSPRWLQETNDVAWYRFHRYLLMYGWNGTHFWRNKFIWDYTFSRAEKARNLKPNPYLADTVKHLFAMAAGASPGFTVASDEQAAPVDLLQKIYLDIYLLKQYAPLFMQLFHFNHQFPIYYSLQIPTTTEFSPKSRRIATAMDELREVRHLTQTVLEEILQGKFGMHNTPFYETAICTRHRYFHTDSDRYAEIERTYDLLTADRFLQHHVEAFPGRIFPENSPFVRGCVQISSVRV